jgi:hypothetical protein
MDQAIGDRVEGCKEEEEEGLPLSKGGGIYL